MMWSRATHGVFAFLNQRALAPQFPVLVGLSAFLSTVTFTLPVELLVVASVLLNRYRWISIAAFSAVGGSLASLGIYLAFHHLGWDLLIAWYPDIAASKAWADAVSYTHLTLPTNREV